ncbi:MAG: nucleotidyltransferase family protein [Verrucomicrobiota bacterium]
MRHAGIVLAAGASSRMGAPKATLRNPQGRTLADLQIALLMACGIENPVLVLGSEAEAIQADVRHQRIAVNPDWTKGRVSSAQTGLRALNEVDGCFILPVDTAGISPDTVRAMSADLQRQSAIALRPCYRNQPGHLVWISHGLAANLLKVRNPTETIKLRDYIEPFERRLAVDDPNILNNINTPEAWDDIRSELHHF